MTLIRIVLVSILLFASLSGCSTIQLAVSFSPDVQKLRDGEREFKLGNFEKAEEIFLNIYQSDTTPQTKNTALYNLACTRIIAATDSEEFLAAVHLLDNWQKTYPTVIFVEDPNLIIAALQARSQVIMTDKIAVEEERDTVLSQAHDDKGIINRQKRQIVLLNSQLQTLQHQIQELETIDQQLQEKKKPL